MQPSGGRRVTVTGAAGFIGRAVVDRIARGALGPVADLRLNDVRPVDHPSAVVIAGSFAEAAVRDRLIGDGVDVLFHLASLPGGASERDPARGKQVNLDGSIALIDAAAGAHRPVTVYTSSIAAIGRADGPVSAATALHPAGSYGTHKAMIEFYLADLTRRGVVDARTVRPAGIVARPREAYAGFATAWMSDLFHAAVERRALTVPSRADAHVWLQSVDAVVDNIIHAARMPAERLPPGRVWTLPATRVRVDMLVAALAAGFGGDGDVAGLVDTVLARIARSG